MKKIVLSKVTVIVGAIIIGSILSGYLYATHEMCNPIPQTTITYENQTYWYGIYVPDETNFYQIGLGPTKLSNSSDPYDYPDCSIYSNFIVRFTNETLKYTMVGNETEPRKCTITKIPESPGFCKVLPYMKTPYVDPKIINKPIRNITITIATNTHLIHGVY